MAQILKAKRKPLKSVRRSRGKSKASSVLAKAQVKAKARHARMLEYAKTHRPPQSWFEQNDCPFTPTKG